MFARRRLPVPALAAAALLLVLLGGISRPARALAEDDVTFAVVQSPASPATVQVGSHVTFAVTATVNNSLGVLPLLLDFDYPAGLTFVSGISSPPGVACADNSPAPGIVRCNYGPVPVGSLVPLTLTFSVQSSVTTAAGQAVMRAGVSDGAPDSAADGADAFTGAGALTVFDGAMFTANGTPSPAAAFERAAVTYTATLTNNSGAATGTFDASLQLPGAVVQSITCSSGTPGPVGFAQANCAGANLPNSATLTITADLLPQDTAGGDDIAPRLVAAALGVDAALPGITVHEVGLQRTSGAPAVGSPVIVCTAAVASDVANAAAAGAAQPNDLARMKGTNSAQAVLQLSDFTVTGPAGSVTAAAASGCGANQSGVTFTPAAPGTYTITARYNTGGTNVLAIDVAGGSNPVPALAAIAPTSAVAGSGALTLTLTGSNFIAASEVRWNGSPLAAVTYVSSTSLTATVPAGLLAAPGTASVTVHNPAPGGGTSSPQVFTISAGAAKLAFTTQPGNGTAGSPLSVQPVVAVQTSAGATVTSDNTTVVTLAVSGSATLTCTGGLSKTVTAGVAAFTGCTVTPAGTGYTLTATSSPALTPATSAPFNVTAAPPTSTSQLAFPAVTGPVPRSRLTFQVDSGTLNPSEVRLTIRRGSDNKYWNAASAAWQTDPVQNVMTSAGGSSWQLAVTGVARRSFLATTVTIEAFATAGGTEYRSAATATLTIR
jgi:hypothetical protein